MAIEYDIVSSQGFAASFGPHTDPEVEPMMARRVVVDGQIVGNEVVPVRVGMARTETRLRELQARNVDIPGGIG
jgi:hypothetical protein